MNVSLIIPYYKQITYLELVMEALKRQSIKDFEVIIAEDDNSVLTKELIQKYSAFRIQHSAFKIKHVFQEDIGFRKNRILNEAIRCSEGELIVFLDGDCIPHKHYILQYLKHAEEKMVLLGRRVNVSKKLSEIVVKSKDICKLNLFNLYRYGSQRVEEGFYLPYNIFQKNKKRGIVGCNWGILKKHLIEINGFDEDYEEAGVGEDSDIDWRLLKSGCTMKSLKNKAIVYHLHHQSNFTNEGIKHNLEIMKRKQSEGHYSCRNGIMKVQ